MLGDINKDRFLSIYRRWADELSSEALQEAVSEYLPNHILKLENDLWAAQAQFDTYAEELKGREQNEALRPVVVYGPGKPASVSDTSGQEAQNQDRVGDQQPADV